jgi:hypothetical protein
MKDLRRCYNTKSCLEKLAAVARERALSRRNAAAHKPTANYDAARIIGVAIANNAERFGREWVRHGFGDFAAFRKALAWKSLR